MPKLPRRPSKAKPAPSVAPATPPGAPAQSLLTPAEELEARLKEPEEGPFLRALENRVVYPTLIETITDAGERIFEVLREHDSPELWRWYEELEAEVGFVRERSAFGLGWQHGSADGRAEAFRSHAPGLAKPAKRIADQARALVVNGGLTTLEATALLLETAWALALSRPEPSFEG